MDIQVFDAESAEWREEPIDPQMVDEVKAMFAENPHYIQIVFDRFVSEDPRGAKAAADEAFSHGHDTDGVNHHVFEAAVKHEARRREQLRRSQDTAA